MKKRYLIQHKQCGGVLFKAETAILFDTQIKCPLCKEIILIPDDVVITPERERMPGLEKAR